MQANKIVSRIVLGTIIWGAAEARAADKMSVIDFLLDWKQYIRQRVTVTDCALLRLGETLVYCYHSGTLTGAIIIQGDTLPRDDRKVLLSGCTIIPQPNCVGDVTGTVSSEIFGPTLKNPSIDWKTKP
jgi:hypothetical protein